MCVHSHSERYSWAEILIQPEKQRDIQNLNPNCFSPGLLNTLSAFCEPPFPNQYLAHPSYKGLSMQIHYLLKHSMAISQNNFIDNCIVMLFDGKRESITVSLWLKEERTIGRLLILKYITGVQYIFNQEITWYSENEKKRKAENLTTLV